MSALRTETVIYAGHPSWRAMLDFHTGGVVLAAAGGAIAGLVSSNWGYAVAAFAAILALSLVAGVLRRVATSYTITDRHLHISRGILTRIEQQTTIDRVQDTSMQQTLFERMLRVGTVTFNTAATEQSEFVFEGVAEPRTVVAAVDAAQHAAIDAEPAVPSLGAR